MKKNISINISGIIFHIEEDGYEQLKDYLTSVNDYFASFDESEEIVADIESRIAEIFLAKLNEGKQIITSEDVKGLIATMGSVEDFQAIEEQEAPSQKGHKGRRTRSSEGYKNLYRDGKRKLLGGVSAGIAHYFNIDPLWTRLIIFLLAVGSVGVIAFAYVILWVAIPESHTLEEDTRIKKMYRNPDQKVISGVSGGIASYFGIDASIIRLLFITTIFLGGAGIICYIILWIILPEAKTITEKVQMQGNPVTLSNIERNIKASLNVKEGEENLFIRILLFPFRLISIVLSGLAKGLGPLLLFLVEAVRVLAGFVLIIIGMALFFSLATAIGTLTGLFPHHAITLGDIGVPVDMVSTLLPHSTGIALFFFSIIPAVALILTGLSIIAKRRLFTSTVGWSLFAVWAVGLIFLCFTVPSILYQFRERGVYPESSSYTIPEKTVILKLQEAGMEHYNRVNLRLEGHDGASFKLIKEYKAHGASRRAAIENAQQIEYGVALKDSIFTFDSNLDLPPGTVFKMQQVNLTLYIPYHYEFIMKEDLKYILEDVDYRYDYHDTDFHNKVWAFTPAGLECTTCKDEPRYETKPHRERRGEYSRKYDFTDFDRLWIGSAFDVDITHGEEYKIVIEGYEKDIDQVQVTQNGSDISISFNEQDFHTLEGEYVRVSISLPQLQELKLSGRSKTTLANFEQEGMTIELSDESTLDANIDIQELKLWLDGATDINLKGEGRALKARIRGTSQLEAQHFLTTEAYIEAQGTSKAHVYVNGELKVDKSIVSTIRNRGTAEIVPDEQ